MASTLAWSDFELKEKLGEGQAAIVWSAVLRRPYKQLHEGSLIAVKRYKRWVLEELGQYDRIYRELFAGTRVRHQNLVEGLALCADPDGLPVLAMKYYAGETLETFLQSQRESAAPIDLAVAFRVIGELSSGLAALHQAELIHRDVKPSNVMLANDGHTVLMDLGVISCDAIAEQSQTRQFLGTIRYSAPEYLAGETCTTAADAYSLGAIAFELFEKREFYGEVKHWAFLVASRLHEVQRPEDKRYQSYYSDGEYINVEHIAHLGGIHAAEAVHFVLKNLLMVDPQVRLTDLAHLSSQIEKKFWQGPFHLTGNLRIVNRPPRKVSNLRDMFDSRPSYSIEAAFAELLQILPASELALFAKLVAAAYWFAAPLSVSQVPHIIKWRRLGLIYPGGAYSDEQLQLNPTHYTFHVSQTAKYLYRYGYFDNL